MVYCSAMGEPKDVAAALTKQFNQLAAAGWEHAGPVVENTFDSPIAKSYLGVAGQHVLFKRPAP